MNCLVVALCVIPVVSPEDVAIGLALQHQRTVHPIERRYWRYLWNDRGIHEDLQAMVLTLNYISRSPNEYRPMPVDAAKTVVAVDLRRICGKDFQGYAETWWNLRYDPRFSLLITRATAQFAGISVKFEQGEDVVKLPSPHLDLKAFCELEESAQSVAAIVSRRYFVARALSQVQNKGVGKTVYGGLYYQFRGIRSAKKGTDEDEYFRRLGVGSEGVTAKQLYDQLRGDRRVAVFKSGVTGRPRQVSLLRQLAADLETQGLVSVTHDIREGNTDIDVHPVLNLLKFKDDAREVIAETQNGLHEFILFDGNGKLQDEVPPDVATDNTIPAGHPARLQPAIGCIRCHAKDAGWRTLTNDVSTMMKSGVFDIFSGRQRDDVERIAGLYKGDAERKIMPRGRDDYNAAILRIAGPWKAANKTQTDVARHSAERIASIYAEQMYEMVDARRALADLGIKVGPKDDALKRLREVIPIKPLGVGEGDNPAPVDGRIVALLSGVPIQPTDWDLVYSYVAQRVKR